MRVDPAYRKITASEFLAMDFGTDRRFELSDGVIYLMGGGTEEQARVQGNVFAWLRHRLRGTGCRPYGPDMAIRVSETDIRYPDISVHCRQPPPDQLRGMTALTDPTAIIEILSPATTTFDQGTKLAEYQSIAGVRTIAFVDPVNEMCRTVERNGPDTWLDRIFSGRDGIAIPSLDLVVPHEEIFARD